MTQSIHMSNTSVGATLMAYEGSMVHTTMQASVLKED